MTYFGLILGLVVLVGAALVVWRLMRWGPASGSEPLEEWKHVRPPSGGVGAV